MAEGIIQIGNKAFNCRVSALTPKLYAEVNGNQRNFFEDVSTLQKYADNVDIETYGKLEDFVLSLVYTMHKQCGAKATYNEFLDSIEDKGDGTWMQDALKLAMSTFPRPIQATSKQQQ